MNDMSRKYTMREYIPKEKVLEIIRGIPSNLHGECVYEYIYECIYECIIELDGIWIDEESGE